MSQNHDMSVQLLSDIRKSLDETVDYDGLVSLEQEARILDDQMPSSVDCAMLIGEIIRKRLDWEDASDYFYNKSHLFENRSDFLYNAALTAIDAGNYLRGRQIILQLAEYMTKLSGRMLRGMWRAAPLVGLHEEALSAYKQAMANGFEGCCAHVESRLMNAVLNASMPALQSIGIVSLGENCLPWQLVNRWGLRPKNKLFIQESPFNLAQTTTNDVAELLRVGLDRLIDTEALSTNKDVNGTIRPLNTTYHFDFNHERGQRFITDNYAGLRARYASRIHNLNRYLQSEPCIYLHYTERNGDILGFVDAIVNATMHTNYVIVVFDAWDGRDGFTIAQGNTIYQKIKLPWTGYTWYQPDHWDSELGTNFEFQLQAVLADAADYLYKKKSKLT